MIVWDKETMSTGFDYIDTQHQHLIEQFNKLSDAIEHGKGREETGAVLDYLQFYTKWHFEREESCMEKYGCPVADANYNAHRIFLKKIDRLYEHYQESDTDPRLIFETVGELKEWIVRHIVGVDTNLHSCVPRAMSDQQRSVG